MGTWASPTTSEKASRLAAVMSEPLPVRGAEETLYGLVGDDTLFDMIAHARSFRPGGDARSLVAATLDEWLNWTPRDSWNEPWEAGVEATLRAVLDEHVARIGEDDLLGRMAKFSEDDARVAVADVIGLDQEEAARLRVEAGLLPAVFVVTDTDGKRYRFERVWGVVTEAPEPAAEAPGLRA